ncbi:PLxRFG domain-containing protein [Desulfovibrio piger]|uniref:PLxRFG domain-containing protein n=2 Tax=Desulfovibrio TaxID=872 RepID=UPI0026EBF22C|nr:PLxRFG domain-containing protein [Desulfovibrio piger]MCI7617225.1 PLxRFG domain-containing protein [Desulfovibrio piger]
MAKLLGPLGKRVFSGGIGNAAKRVAGLYGEEMATETITQMGQGSIEADLGLRDEAPGVLQALGEVAPATFWQTTLMAGGKKGLDLISRRYGRGQQVEAAPAPDQQEGSQTRPEALAAGQNNTAPATDAPKPDPAFIPGDPFTDPAAAQDTEDFVRRFEEAEQAAEEDTAGLARSLDQGKTVDLLAPPPQQEDSPAPGRPSAPVKSAPAVHAPAPGPDIPRQTSPLLSPRDNDGIPAQPGQQVMAAPVFPVEPSPLPAGGVLSQMGQAGPQRQPPVTAVPTQAQVLNTQATPRADTTAPAEGLGMPAPDAIPREAQPAPHAGDMAVPPAMPVQPSVARPVVPMPEKAPMDVPRQEAPDASPRREEQPAPAQTAPEVTAPLMYGGAPISRMPIGDDRRENQADSILQAAEQKAKAAGDARMQAAVAEIQQERKYVGVTHDALWERINSDILPYAAEDAHDATQQPSPQDDFLRDHLVVATITGPAGSPMPPQSEGTPAKRQKSGTSSVAEQRKAILQSLPEDLRKAHKGAPLSKLKELAAQHGRNEESSPEDQLAANGTSYGTVDKPDTIALAHHFSAAFLTGRKFGTIVEARREAASLLGGAVRPATETAKAVDEAIELGVTLAARKTVAEMRERRENDTAIYRALVDLYQRQPRLSVRTSTSMAQQAYSTPAPIAFLASRLAGIDTDTKVFEPTAGNGMLLMEAAPKNTTANELNADRAARLRSQGFTVSERDAVDYAPSGMDVVIANPPFGRVKDAGRQTKEFSANGLTTKELDHAIVARALSSLKQDGRAVLIIGGKKGDDDSRSKKYRAADQVHFWGWLFEHYRVLDHFSVDGKLYERQGAGYPIDIVVLENSGPSRGRVFPGAALPRHYTSFGDLEEVLHGQVVDAAERTPGADGPDTGRVGDGPDSQSGRIDRAADAEIADADRGRVRSGRDAGTDGARSGKRLDPRVRDDRSAETGGGRILGSERPAGESGNDVSKDHTLREIEIAPVLYRGVVPKSEVPTQITGAIDTVSLGVLRNAVNPSRIEEGTLASRPARRPDSLPSRFADMPTIEADSTQWFGPGKAIDADSRNMRKAVHDWARTAFPQGTTVANADTGWRVQVTPSGIKASLHHGYDELLARSVPFIPQIIEGGIHVDSIRKTPQLLSHIFAGKIRLDEQDYVVGFVLREDVNGNRFYDHELTKIISPDWLKPGHPSNEGPSSEGSSGHRTNRGIPSDWLKPGRDTSEEALGDRTNRGDVMNILRERLGVNDGTGQVLFRVAGQFLPPKFKGRRAPSTEAVRRLADKMNSMAANAARVEIVENAGALPQNLRDAYASQADSVEGLYDPTTDTVWLVVENLESLERAAEVWLHENVVHHGLRSALAPAQRRLLLNQLWQIMGGMGNSSIRDIASRYGRDPRSNEAARLLIMEEALANLAERRARGMLRSTQEQSLWRRVVDAIVRAWNGMVHTLTGRRGRMGRSQMERLLDALQGHVMEGRPVAMPDAALEEGTDSAGAFASLSADQQEAARAAWMQLQKDMEAWGRQLDDIADGRGNKISGLTIGATPDVLQRLGAKPLPMEITRHNLTKVLTKHDIPLDTLRDLPKHLANPIMVFKSATMSNAYVMLTEMERNGENLVAAIHFDVDRGRTRVNDIASIHDRSTRRDTGKTVPGWVWAKNQIAAGNLRYYDKTRSSRWFRERAGLQLSSVVNRESYRGIKILTEKDVVKPADHGRGGENTPLASLASRPSGLTESVASGIRALRKVMGRGVSADVEDILSNEEMGKLIPRHDLSLAERLFKLPHWVAKDHAGFAKVYDRQLRRVEERSAALKATLEQVPLLFDGDASKRLGQKEQEQLAAMIWKWDGKQIGPLNAIEKFNVVDQTVNGRDVLELNPDYQKKFRAWLKEQPEPERVKQAFGQVREALDAAFLRAYNKMAAMSDLADTDLEIYRTEFGNIHNYFPHQRTGKYFVVAKVGKETVFRKHFDVPFGSSVREEWAKIVAEHRKDFPDATWEDPREAQKLPDDILGAPIDPEAMEQIISAAASRLGDSEQAERVRSTLLSGVADVLKARGFGAHGIHRQNIPGFETQDVKGVLYSYMAGLNGWLTKMEAAADFARALGKIDASASPRLWEYAAQYTKDMLRNSDQIDRITGNIKSVAFAWYLGGNIKTAVVNLTQNAVVGVPRLQQYVTGGGGHWLKSAMDTIGLTYSGKGLHGAKKLTAEEAAMLQELYGNSVITDAYMEEVRGQISASPSLRMWERFTRLLGWPMSKVEIFNRASLALAAYRAARVGAFKTKALKEYGLEPGQKMTHEQARDFAATLVRDTHFEYGRGNQPEFLRSNVAGRMLSPVFTFRSFGANILNLWWRALLYEGKEGRAFVAKSLGATVALGGLTAFPFYATLAALCAAASGDDEDWTAKIRNALPANNLLRDVVCYGLPSLLGVNIGGSLRMETPFTEGMKRGETFKEAMTESLGDLLGIPYDLAVNKPSKFLEARRFGADYRAVEALVPTFVANIMQAWRLTTEGQTTMRGRPINSPGQPGARKLSTGEAFGKALGFQPTSSTKSYEAYAAEKRRTSMRSDRIDDFTNQALDDLESKGRPYMMRELQKKLQAWNKEMEAEGKPAMKIMPKDVLRRVAARRRENRPTRDQREKGAAQMATWGV